MTKKGKKWQKFFKNGKNKYKIHQIWALKKTGVKSAKMGGKIFSHFL